MPFITARGWHRNRGFYTYRRFKAERPSAVCRCGRLKESQDRRLCDACRERHHYSIVQLSFPYA